MKTLLENTRTVGSSAYYGDRPDWLIAAAVHRDSDCLERSNFESFQDALDKDNPAVEIERFNHWAVGWVDYLIIDPASVETVELAESLRAKLEDYPILDEQHFSQLEQDEANDTWKLCFNPKERVEYIRKHKGQFEFRDFQDMIGCVRGQYFAGYASELLH